MGAGRQPGRAQRSPSRARFLPIALFLCYASWLYLWSSSQGQAERRAARARESAATAAAAVVALGGQAPLLHGPVNKTGTLAQDRWHPRHVAEINRKFLRWVSRRAQRGVHRSALSPHVSPGCAVWAVSRRAPCSLPRLAPLHGCTLTGAARAGWCVAARAVPQSHAYKTIFVRHAKAASTSVLSIFTLCNEPHAKREQCCGLPRCRRGPGSRCWLPPPALLVGPRHARAHQLPRRHPRSQLPRAVERRVQEPRVGAQLHGRRH